MFQHKYIHLSCFGFSIEIAAKEQNNYFSYSNSCTVDDVKSKHKS